MDQFKGPMDLLLDKLEGWWALAIVMLPNLVVAVLTVLLFYGMARLVEKLLRKTLDRFSDNRAVNRLITSISSIFIIMAGAFISLGILQLDKTVTSLLAGIGVLGLALSLAFQNAAANLIAGIIMAVKSPIHVDDLVETNNIFGLVRKIGLRSTTIQNPEGQLVEVPNRLVLENPFTLYSVPGSRRVDLKGHIAYEDDLEKVKEVAIRAIQKLPGLQREKPVEFFYSAFDDSSIAFEFRYWIDFSNVQSTYLDARSQGIILLNNAFKENGIEIPIPRHAIDLDAGDRSPVKMPG